MIGNYGVPVDDERDGISKFFESDKIHCKALWSFRITLPGIVIGIHKKSRRLVKRTTDSGAFGIDTRALTQKLRDHGAMLGKILFDDEDIPFTIRIKITSLPRFPRKRSWNTEWEI